MITRVVRWNKVHPDEVRCPHCSGMARKVPSYDCEVTCDVGGHKFKIRFRQDPTVTDTRAPIPTVYADLMYGYAKCPNCGQFKAVLVSGKVNCGECGKLFRVKICDGM